MFCSVDVLKVLSEEELVERALQEAMEVTSVSTANLVALIPLLRACERYLNVNIFSGACRRTGTLALVYHLVRIWQLFRMTQKV
jgi:hypothetical protein